jgi:hypothetical protein
MSAFRQVTEEEDRLSIKIAQRTKGLVVFGLVLCAVLSVVIFWLIWEMRAELMVMVQILRDMFLRFEVMADNLELMTEQMASIESRVADLPTVADNMTGVTTDVKDVRWTMMTMTGDVAGLAADIGGIQNTTAEMAGHFRQVQLSVDKLSHDVEQMLRPISLLPR